MDNLEEVPTETLLDQIAVLQREEKLVKDELTELKAEIRKRMKVGDYADIHTSDGRDVRVAIQSGGTKYTYDVAAFRKELEPELFADITTVSIDEQQLYEAVSAQRIPTHLLGEPYITEKKGTPRVVITRRAADQ